MSDRTPNATCDVCGTRYYRCLACESIISWRRYCDTQKCFQIMWIARDLVAGGSPHDAFDRLRAIDASISDCTQYLRVLGIDSSTVFEEMP